MVSIDCRIQTFFVNTPRQPMKQSAYEVNTLIRFEGASFEGLPIPIWGFASLRDCFITELLHYQTATNHQNLAFFFRASHQ